MGLFSRERPAWFTWSDNPPSDDRIAVLALAAPYLASQPGFFDVLPTPGSSDGPDLASAWGLTDRADALDILRTLADGLDDATYRAAAPLVRILGGGANPDQLHSDLIAQAADDDDAASREHAFAAAVAWVAALRSKASRQLPRRLPDSIYAWDAARLVDLARVSHAHGWINEAEVWDLIEPARDRAATAYPSWREFGLGFLVGRSFWQATRGEADPIASTFALYAPVVVELHKQPTSPWTKVALRPA